MSFDNQQDNTKPQKGTIVSPQQIGQYKRQREKMLAEIEQLDEQIEGLKEEYKKIEEDIEKQEELIQAISKKIEKYDAMKQGTKAQIDEYYNEEERKQIEHSSNNNKTDYFGAS